MNCEDANVLITNYIDNEIEESQLLELEKHLESCADCKELFNDIKDVVSQLQSLPPVELPEDFHESLMNKIKKDTKLKVINKASKFYYIAALVVALFGATYLTDSGIFTNNEPNLLDTSPLNARTIDNGVPANSLSNTPGEFERGHLGEGIPIVHEEADDYSYIPDVTKNTSITINIPKNDIKTATTQVENACIDSFGMIMSLTTDDVNLKTVVSLKVPVEFYDEVYDKINDLGNLVFKEELLVENDFLLEDFIDLNKEINSINAEISLALAEEDFDKLDDLYEESGALYGTFQQFSNELNFSDITVTLQQV